MTPNRFSWTFTVGAESIDGNDHVNNLEYLRWMLEIASRHAVHVGADIRAAAAGIHWIVRSHQIEYRLPALQGDELELRTWVEDVQTASSVRRYEFRRTKDDKLIAAGATNWVCMNRETNRPTRIPKRVLSCFFGEDEG